MLRTCAFFAAVLALGSSLHGQSPAFEVASVKPNKSTDFRGGGIQFYGARFTARNYPLQLIIAAAWNLPFQSTRLIGAPDWIGSERFDIEATAPAEAIKGLPDLARNEKMRLMLRSLLADRFQLKMQIESKEMPVFFILPGKGGPKFEKSGIEEKDCEGLAATPVSPANLPCHVFAGGRGRGLHGRAVDMEDLAMYVENWAERPVIDKTSIKGLFKIETSPWLPMTPGPVPAAGARAEDGSDYASLPTLFGVFQQLGLRLEPQKAAVDIYRIEKIERPSQN